MVRLLEWVKLECVSMVRLLGWVKTKVMMSLHGKVTGIGKD